jgi:hypothetical protein
MHNKDYVPRKAQMIYNLEWRVNTQTNREDNEIHFSFFFLTQILLCSQTKFKSHTGQHKVVLPIPEER